MKILIKKATLHQEGKTDSTKKDILIENGMITDIARSISDGKATIVESEDLHVSPGWLDIGAQPGQPGYEYRETFTSLSSGASAGGYTALAPFPRTKPPIQSRVEVEYLTKLNAQLPVHLFPVGTVSADLEGKDLTEMIDMIQAGVVAFSDGRKNPLESGLLTRALEYVLPYSAVIIEFPLNRNLTADGLMHEGKVSTSLGMTGIPTVAEDITIQRDIKLLAYTGSRIHFHAVTSAASLGYIQKAKADNMKVSCDIPAMHLMLEDRDVGDFDSYKKVLPPFRENRDRQAMIKALRDGVADHISSIHTPLEKEQKECEFPYAGFGSVGLESAYAVANTVLKEHMPVEDIVRKFYLGPRNILSLPVPKIEKKLPAELTLFDPGILWTYPGARHSLSSNDALAGHQVTGMVIGTIAKGRAAINRYI